MRKISITDHMSRITTELEIDYEGPDNGGDDFLLAVAVATKAEVMRREKALEDAWKRLNSM